MRNVTHSRGHYCSECNDWWQCQAEPCLTPFIEPHPIYGCAFDWRDSRAAGGQPKPEESAMAQNLYPSRDLWRLLEQQPGYAQWLVWQVFNVTIHSS